MPTRVQTTFYSDFKLANAFGLSTVEHFFKRTFAEWQHDYKYMTELTIALNAILWELYTQYEKRPSKRAEDFVNLYNRLWSQCDDFCRNHESKEARRYYFQVTD